MCSYHIYGSVRLSVDLYNILLNGCTKLYSTNPLFLYVEFISIFVIMKNDTKDSRASSFSETTVFLFSALIILLVPPFKFLRSQARASICNVICHKSSS